MNIVTNADWDGLVSTALIYDVDDVASVRLVHPRDIESGKEVLTEHDFLLNLPYSSNAGGWIDHYLPGEKEKKVTTLQKGFYGEAASCARLIYNQYRLDEWNRYEALIESADRFNMADLSLSDILNPEGWIKLATILDPATGFPVSYQYFTTLLEFVRSKSMDEILGEQIVIDRVRDYLRHFAQFKTALEKFSRLEGSVVFTDFRSVHEKLIGSKFLVYALFPSAFVSITAKMDQSDPDHLIISIGKSIINRSCNSDIVSLLSEIGGGGRRKVGSCKIHTSLADETISTIIFRLNEIG